MKPKIETDVPVPVRNSAPADGGLARSDLSRLMLEMPVGGSVLVDEDCMGYRDLKTFRSCVSQRNKSLASKGRWLVRRAADGWRLFRVDPELYPAPVRRQARVQRLDKATGQWVDA